MADNSLSLYFSLKTGENADLEIVAEAALQWVAALRAAAEIIEPGSVIKVELIDAAESSLRLNIILEWSEEQLRRLQDGSGKYPRLRRLAIALAIFVPITGYPTYQAYFGDTPPVELSEEDRERLDNLLDAIRGAPEVEEKRRKFFRTVERDASISGVGVAEGRSEPPALLVPSNEFAERGGLWAIVEDERDRTLRPILDLVLISPVLVRRPRHWTFQQPGLPEFKARMEDRRFLAALEKDHVRERLRIGIQMTVRMEIREAKVDGDWVVRKRAVTEVISPKID